MRDTASVLLRDAESTMRYASAIIGVRPDILTTKMFAEEIPVDWETYHDVCLMLMKAVHDLIKSPGYEYYPLIKCLRGVKAEDLMYFVLAFAKYLGAMHILGPEEPAEEGEEYVEEFGPNKAEAYAKDLIMMIYSGYDIGYWTQLILDMYRKKCCSSLEYITTFLTRILSMGCQEPTTDGQDVMKLSCFCGVSKAIPNFREFIRISLSVDPGIMGDVGKQVFHELSKLEDKYIEICYDTMCINEETALRLLDNYIPCLYDYSGYISRKWPGGNEEVVWAAEEASSVREFYYLLFEGDPDTLNYMLNLYTEAFDTLSHLLLNPYFVKELLLAKPEGSEEIYDVSNQIYSIIKDALEYVIESALYVDTKEVAIYELKTSILSVLTFSEGMLILLDDPETRNKLLKRISPIYKDDVSDWLFNAHNIIKQQNTMLEFPDSLAIAAILNMPGREAYAYVVSRGRVPL